MRTPFRDLTPAEQRAVLDCMEAILNGPYISDEEFQTRLGIERAELASVISDWPDLDDADVLVRTAINGSLNEVLNGVGIEPGDWRRWSDTALKEVERVFRKWKGPRRPWTS